MEMARYWVDRFDAIFAIDPPNIDNDRKDKVVWGNGRVYSETFFMMWLAVHKILKTHDTMGVWEKKFDMVSLIQYSQQLASTLSSHETCFTQAVDSMFFMHEGLQQARARIYDVLSAIEILLTGTYERLPKCTEDVGIHSTLTDKQQKPVLKKLDTLVRLNYLKLHYPNSSPRLKFLMVLGETIGPVKLEETRRFVLGDDLERRMATFDTMFTTLYTILHEFCVPLIMDTVIRQIQALRIGRWKGAIWFELISDGYRTSGDKILYWLESDFVQTSQDGEADFVGLRTSGDKILYCILVCLKSIESWGENSHIRRAGGDVLHTGLNEPGSEDNKLELPRLALVKIRLEDKPSSITWEEKHQPDGPGSEVVNGDSSFLIGSFLDVPVGQELTMQALVSFAEGDSDRPVCSDDIRSPEIIATVKLELNSLNFPDMCAKETHSCLLKSHFENVTSSALDCSSLGKATLDDTKSLKALATVKLELNSRMLSDRMDCFSSSKSTMENLISRTPSELKSSIMNQVTSNTQKSAEVDDRLNYDLNTVIDAWNEQPPIPNPHGNVADAVCRNVAKADEKSIYKESTPVGSEISLVVLKSLTSKIEKSKSDECKPSCNCISKLLSPVMYSAPHVAVNKVFDNVTVPSTLTLEYQPLYKTGFIRAEVLSMKMIMLTSKEQLTVLGLLALLLHCLVLEHIAHDRRGDPLVLERDRYRSTTMGVVHMDVKPGNSYFPVRSVETDIFMLPVPYNPLEKLVTKCIQQQKYNNVQQLSENDLECHLLQKGLQTTGGASTNLSVLSTIAFILGYNLHCAKTRKFCADSSMYKDKLENMAFGPKLVATAEDDKPVARYGLFLKKTNGDQELASSEIESGR
ncbi:mediator of RNA polymerase II transcription subunit 14 [Tanacetum coccineum]